MKDPYPCLAHVDGTPCPEIASYVVTVASKLDGERDLTLRCHDHRDRVNVHFEVVGHTPIQ